MYCYEVEREKLFTLDGFKMVFDIAANVTSCLDRAGAVRASEAWRGVTGDTWKMLACLDYLIELKEIREITAPGVRGQDRVFVSAKP